MKKPSFPRFLNLLFDEAFQGKPVNLMSGVCKCELYQLNKDANPKAKLIRSITLLSSHTATEAPSPAAENESDRISLHKAMHIAITDAVCPPVSQSTKEALETLSINVKEFKSRMVRF